MACFSCFVGVSAVLTRPRCQLSGCPCTLRIIVDATCDLFSVRRVLPFRWSLPAAPCPFFPAVQGANTSALLSDEIDDISRDSKLTPSEVRRLYKRFQQLDRNRSGNLDADELRMIPELAMNPLMPRIVALFDNANFAQFVRTMAVFGRNGTKEAKTDFAFRVYDVDGDGYISSDDLRGVLQMMVGADNLDEATTTRIVQKVIDDADTDGDQRISREEFTLVRLPPGLGGVGGIVLLLEKRSGLVRCRLGG